MDSDEPAEPGELGRIVITDLFNYAFPILRYDNGDTAVAVRKEKIGRFKLYLSELYGRRSDLIYDCKGNAVTPYIITNNLWDIEGVKQYRFIQEDEKDYTIWLNGDPEKMDQEEMQTLQNAITRSVTTCYTLEGSYPQSLGYLKKHYGLHYDENKYFVDYQPLGANIMPDITIIRKEADHR